MVEAADGSPDDPRVSAESVLSALFESAHKAGSVDFVYTLLRVGGLEMAGWDSFEESRAAFNDYNWLLGQARGRGLTSARRVGLLMYCQAIEMDFVHNVLVNLLRCTAEASYAPAPLRHLGRRKKNPKGLEVFAGYVPPSAKQKFMAIKQLAARVHFPALVGAIDKFFDDRVRNAFFHSDYTLTNEYFRFREGGLAQQIDVDALDRLITECFAFYGVFMGLHERWLHLLGRGKRFYKCPGYEVLELLSTEDEGLYGFNMHFSTGSKATFIRRKSTGTMGSTNIIFEKGGINFNVGSLDAREEVWKIEGVPVDDWSVLP